MKHQYSVNTSISSVKCWGNRGYRRLRHNRKEQKKRSACQIGKSGAFVVYMDKRRYRIRCCYMYVPGKRKIGEIGDFTINLKEKSICSDEQSTEIRAPISPISPVIRKHTPGFPSREGMLYGAKGLEFPKNSPWGWVGLEQAHSRVLCPFRPNP